MKGAWSVPSWLPARAQVGAAMASCWHETKVMAGQPCPPTKLKYLAVTVMTAASTVLAKSVRFLETCKSRVLCRYREYRAFHTIMYVYSWFIVLTESLLTVRLAVSEIKPVQSLTDKQTDRQTDRQNCQLQ